MAKLSNTYVGRKILLAIACALAICIGVGTAFAADLIDDPALPVSDILLEEPFAVTVSPDEDVVVFDTGEKTELTAATTGGEDEGVEASYQWQIYVEGADIWVDIQGQNDRTIDLTVGVLYGALNEEGAAQVRCVATSVGGDVAESAAVEVSVVSASEVASSAESDLASEPLNLPAVASYNFARVSSDASVNHGIALADSDGGAVTNYNVVINYQFEDGTTAAEPFAASLAAGSALSDKVTFPTVLGYLAYFGESSDPTESYTFGITNIQGDVTYTVTYKPTNVDYTVIHYWQNPNDDNYSEKERKTLEGLTKSVVPEVANSYDGFYALPYERPAIAADGSTVIEIYYDRLYYLMTFDLDGGYGTEPVYARYGADVAITAPMKDGYTFEGWTLNGGKVDLPTTMPFENRTYTANWKPVEGGCIATVVYWLQNADPDANGNYGYSYWTSYQLSNLTVGKELNSANYVNIPDDLKTNLDYYEMLYSEHNGESETVTVKGDGTTILNVYYDRKEYTLKFYYAMSSGTDDNDNRNDKYYVIGGSTYYFGKNAGSNVNNSSEVALLDQYMSTYVSHRGGVDELPTLNSTGMSRNYESGFDTSRVNGTTYKYYYVSFAAKYGADIAHLWPCSVFNSVTRSDKDDTNGWSGEEAFVGSWNGEHHVYYSEHNENQTIKGKYSVLDHQLLWDYDNFNVDSSTVAYLCFWENGANIGWSIPELYRYNIYVQDDAGEKEYEGQNYRLVESYDTCDDSDVSKQTTPSVKGLTYVGIDSSAISGFDTTKYAKAYNVNFYYESTKYMLTLKNGSQDTQIWIAAGSSLPNDYAIPTYSGGDQGSHDFQGWFTTEAFLPGSEFDFKNAKMPTSNLILYAKWTAASHTVKVYKTADDAAAGKNQIGSDIAVLHGSKVNPNFVPTTPDRGNYKFVGWFYLDGQVEKAFDFSNMPVYKDMVVYAKWSSDVLMQYVVYYKNEDSQTSISSPVALELNGSALAGSTKTFEAKAGSDLYEGYRESYFPTVKSHSIRIEMEETADGNEWYAVDSVTGDRVQGYTFWYVKKDAVPYIVRYVDESGKELSDSKVVSENRKAVVTEKFVVISEYRPDAYQKRLVLTGAEAEENEWIEVTVGGKTVKVHPDNIITFTYTKDTKHAYYKVTHYTQNTDGETWTEYASSQVVGEIGKEYSASPLTIDGFTYDAARSTSSGELTKKGMELQLYYTRNSYPYEVRYLEYNTSRELAKSKVSFDLYGKVISETAINVENYTVVGPSSQTMNIKIEESQTEAKVNIITFYYTENEATIKYKVVGPDGCGSTAPESETVKVKSGAAAGSTATPSSNLFRFVGWYKSEECTEDPLSTEAKFVPMKVDDKNVSGTYYAKFESNLTSLTIKKSGWNSLDDGQTFIFDISTGEPSAVVATVVVVEGGSTTVSGLIAGEAYTVTERSGWSWRYSANSETITLKPEGTENTVTVGNTRDKTKWLDFAGWCKNVFGGSNAGATSNNTAN